MGATARKEYKVNVLAGCGPTDISRVARELVYQQQKYRGIAVSANDTHKTVLSQQITGLGKIH